VYLLIALLSFCRRQQCAAWCEALSCCCCCCYTSASATVSKRLQAAAAAAASEAAAVAESATASAPLTIAVSSARRSAVSSARRSAAAAAALPAPFTTMSHRAMLNRDAATRCETVAHTGQRRLTMFNGLSACMHGNSSGTTVLSAPAFKPGVLHALDALAAAAAPSGAEQDQSAELLWPVTGTSSMRLYA
jgi:hypothetical protein